MNEGVQRLAPNPKTHLQMGAAFLFLLSNIEVILY